MIFSAEAEDVTPCSSLLPTNSAYSYILFMTMLISCLIVSPHCPSQCAPLPSHQYHRPSTSCCALPNEGCTLCPWLARYPSQQYRSPSSRPSIFVPDCATRFDAPTRGAPTGLACNQWCDEDGNPASYVRHGGAYPTWHGAEDRPGRQFPASSSGRACRRQYPWRYSSIRRERLRSGLGGRVQRYGYLVNF